MKKLGSKKNRISSHLNGYSTEWRYAKQSLIFSFMTPDQMSKENIDLHWEDGLVVLKKESKAERNREAKVECNPKD